MPPSPHSLSTPLIPLFHRSPPPPALTLDYPPSTSQHPYNDTPSPSPPPTSTYPPYLLSDRKVSLESSAARGEVPHGIPPRLLDLSPSARLREASAGRSSQDTGDVFSVHASRAELFPDDKYGEEDGRWEVGEGTLPLLREEGGEKGEELSGWRTWWGWKRRKVFWGLGGAVLLVVLLLGALSAVRHVRETWVQGNEEENGGDSGGLEGGEKGETTGGDGSVVQRANGGSFVYRNEFGGTWDSTSLGSSARAQADTPRLSEPWDYSTMTISGVNLGGWLTLEPFISPSLFEPFLHALIPAEDEWTLSINLGDRLGDVLEQHYETFITEEDFAAIAGAGLNWVRIPLPFWAIEVYDDEPFLAHVCWKYFLKAMVWARKYGLRIKLDLHAVPGSQNGYNHSGRLGEVGFLNGVMGVANAQRTLNYIKTLADFISTPRNSELVPVFGALNEPKQAVIGHENLRGYYAAVYEVVRGASGLGAGNGPMISLHDGFQRQDLWFDFLEGSDRVALDTHSYLCFTEPNDDPLSLQALKPCQKWAIKHNHTMESFGMSLTGEWSLAVNDCGRFLNTMKDNSRFAGTYPTVEAPWYPALGSCAPWADYRSWDAEMKKELQKVALAHMDAFQNWFFWTWKTGITLSTNLTANPLWSYSLGLREGYIPSNPRTSHGFCLAHGDTLGRPLAQSPWSGVLTANQVGGPGAGVPAPIESNRFPPERLGEVDQLDVSVLPVYEPNGIPVVLADPAFPSSDDEKAPGWYAPIPGCEYPNAWSAVGAPVPTARCQVDPLA